ncbi:zonular occludens toxin domain-containing protein [Photobacterium piscicola]|uniref:Zonular occludens toxin domain-containing protein n=1 Tax=Photobacterium piscicola TaxID=1378299 RepID=A0ABU6LD08_9GAMM|nr:zonular occludens toxin domain-containing protein [Photobacterium piscicola]
MMVLVTGTPGAGKTLNTIKDVYEEVQKTPYFSKKSDDGITEQIKREVYACNINGLDLEKSGFKILEDPTKWTTLPAGSILIIDEASDFYPTSKKFGADLESDIAELRKHRHYGIDIYYITQQPGLINKNIRVLCGQHTHYQRNFGGKSTNCYKNNAVFDTDATSLRFAQQNGAVKSSVRLDKKYFSFYKSTEIDTHKSKLPLFKLFQFIGLPIIALICAVIYFLNSDFYKRSEVENSNIKIEQPTKDNKTESSFFGTGKKHLTTKEYLDQMKPRIPFKPETAPIYDDLRKPKSFPRLSSCLMITNKPETCECFTQQNTVLNIPIAQCIKIVNTHKKPFDYTKKDTF